MPRHTHTLSLPFLHTLVPLSMSLSLSRPRRPFKLLMSFSVGCQNTIWLLATLPGVVSHFHSIQAGSRKSGEGKGEEGCLLDKGVLRSPIDKRPLLPAHQSLSERTNQANSGQPTTNGRWCQLPLLLFLLLPLHTVTHRMWLMRCHCTRIQLEIRWAKDAAIRASYRACSTCQNLCPTNTLHISHSLPLFTTHSPLSEDGDLLCFDCRAKGCRVPCPGPVHSVLLQGHVPAFGRRKVSRINFNLLAAGAWQGVVGFAANYAWNA